MGRVTSCDGRANLYGVFVFKHTLVFSCKDAFVSRAGCSHPGQSVNPILESDYNVDGGDV